MKMSWYGLTVSDILDSGSINPRMSKNFPSVQPYNFIAATRISLIYICMSGYRMYPNLLIY